MQLAVIPARGGSKRIPRKNIKEFNGKPMIAWSIEAALACDCINEVWVSTDDTEIAAIALDYGAQVPFIRPAHLADDFATTAQVMHHAIHSYQTMRHTLPAWVCCIYATAPFIQSTDVQQGFELIRTRALDYVFSATSYPFPIQRAIKLAPNQTVQMFTPDAMNIRSQDLEAAWHDAGQFYWGSATAWLNQAAIFSSQSSIVALPRFRVQDIDTEDDWERAQIMAQILAKV